MNVVELLTIAKKINNCLVNSNTWTTTTTQIWTVPVGKRWWIFGGITYRDTATGTATLDIKALDAANKKIFGSLDSAADAAVVRGWPNGTAGTYQGGYPFPLDAGEYILVTIGQAQGAAAYLSLVVLEVDV